MKINNLQNNPSFKSRFEFIPYEGFNAMEAANKALEVGHSIYGDCQCIRGGNIYTKYISSCTAYGLTEKAEKRAMLGHYNKEAAKKFTQLIKFYADKGRAFAIGGDINEMSEFFEHDIKLFKEKKIPTTIFWGQDGQCSNAWFNADEDTWYIALGGFTSKNIGSIEDIKYAYKIINVADGDEVCINGKYVEPKLINQNNNKYKW